MEKQSERKNNRSKAVIIVIAMLLMVALVVGMGAMTYSRYITSGTTGSQIATAAKWGFVVTVDASNILGKSYKATAENTLATVDSTGVAVKVTGDANVVAPGTTGSMTISINGSAEVLAALEITAVGLQEISYTKDESTYNPVKWSLSEQTDGSILSNVKLIDITSKLAEQNKTFEANTSYNKKYTLTWSWDLDSGNDEKDTAIGKAVAGTTESGATIVTEMTFNISVSVKQVQTKTA